MTPIRPWRGAESAILQGAPERGYREDRDGGSYRHRAPDLGLLAVDHLDQDPQESQGRQRDAVDIFLRPHKGGRDDSRPAPDCYPVMRLALSVPRWWGRVSGEMRAASNLEQGMWSILVRCFN